MSESDGQVRRNFRSAYYGKLGFSGNEEKNHLDILIDMCPLDSGKLKDLFERPELDRKCIDAWKIFLGVDCARKNPFDEYANVAKVRTEHFQMLKHHLEVLLKHNSNLNFRRTSLGKASHDTRDNSENENREQSHIDTASELDAMRAENAKLITQMYLLESGRLNTLDIDQQFKSDEIRSMVMMATFFVTIANDLQEAFFLFRNFTNHIQNKPKS